MPNTLAHVGFQGVITRSVSRGSDIKWIGLGCVLPDIPWIVQRLVRFAVPGVDPYALRLYGIVQASFLFCLVLGLAIAALTDRPGRTFGILSFNALLHLLLDASQIKWATGVNLLAPFDWRMTRFGSYWPESWPTYLLTGLGLGLLLFTWREGVRTPAGLSVRSARRVGISLVLLALYALLPLFLMDGPRAADDHFVKTLGDRARRPGRYVEIDRRPYEPGDGGGRIRTYAGESLRVDGIDLERPAVVSIRGRFEDEDRVRVEAYHVHTPFRNLASLVGLSLLAMLWLVSPAGRAMKRGRLRFLRKKT